MKSVQERVAAGGKLLVPPSRVLLSLLVPLSLPGIVSLEHIHMGSSVCFQENWDS